MGGPCPWCKGTDRFRLWPDRGRYWCRGCGEKGDAISYLRRRDNLTFAQAVAGLGGGSLPARGSVAPPPPPPSPRRPDPAPWAVQGLQVAMECAAALWHSPAALDYLRRRGLHDETIPGFLLGWNERDGHRHGLYVPAGWTIPIIGPDGSLHGLKVRRNTTTGERRYTQVDGGHPALMGRLAGKPALLVTEGEFDAMLAHQEAGHLVDVATLGSCVGTPDPWALYLLPYRRILLCYDLDDEGEKGRLRWGRFRQVAQVRLPMDPARGKDVTDHVLAGGGLRGWVRLLAGGDPPPPCPAGTPPQPTPDVPTTKAPPPVAPPTDVGDRRELLLARAGAAGWPRLRYRPSESVCPGERAWRIFVDYATTEEVELALRALEKARC